MNKRIVATAVCAVLALALCGCTSTAEEPNLPNPGAGAPDKGYTLTDPAKLKELSVGDAAVWRDYEVAVQSIERSDGQLNVQIELKAHAEAQDLPTECLLSLGMPPVSSTFEGGVISARLGQAATGTLTFDDRCTSQRLLWNDGATEATWLLDKAPTSPEPPKQPETPAQPEKPKTEAGGEGQAKAVAAVEAALPGLIADNTYYTYQGFDPATASVVAVDGGYQYSNAVSILDGNGNAATTNVSIACDAKGAVTSMSLDGVVIF